MVRKRTVAWILCILMLFTVCAVSPMWVFGAEENAALGRYAYAAGKASTATLGLTDGSKTNNSDSLKFQNFKSRLTDEITDESDNYILVDLGAKYDISSVNLAGYTGVTTAAKVYFSNDPEVAIADWTYYGKMPQVQQTSSGYDIEGQALTARYIRVYVTYYRYGTMTPAENWFYLNEITVMGSLHAGETAPDRVTDGALLFAPQFGRVENYQGRTSFILSVPTIFGGTAAENTALASALRNRTYRVTCTIKDENTGECQSFDYSARDLGYELPGSFWRLPVCEYGCTLTPGHAFTLSLAVYDGSKLLYAGTSAEGAFTPDETNSASLDFLKNGPIVPLIDVDRDSPLAGKTILFAGDSITEAICERYNPLTTPIAGWPGRVGTANCMSFVNSGVSGATMSLVNVWNSASTAVSSRNVIYNQLVNNKGTKFDLIVLQGGVNDAWCSAPVGSMTAADNFDESTFDVSTFAGGFEYTIAYAKKTYPEAKIGFIVNFAMPASTNGRTSDMSEYFSVAKAICDKWNIPYMDLYNNAEVTGRLQPTTRYALGDYVHPNNRGYDILYPYVEQFVKALDKGDDPSALTDPVYSGEVSDGAEILPTDRILSTGKRLKNAAGTVTTNFGAYGTDSCYAQMDLGRLCEIEKIHLVCGGDKTLYAFVNAVFKYEIQVSRDGETFETVFTKTDNEMEFENGYTVAVEKVQARYIRVIGLYYSKGTDFTISKMDVYGTAIGEPVNPDGGEKTNVASGKDAWIYTQESSKIGSYSLKTASGITNGVLTDNTWAYGTFGEFYALIDLGESCIISSVNVVAYAPYNHAWSVYVSTDGVAYSKVAAVDTQAHPAEGVTVNFDEVSARYVRIVADYYVTPQQFSFREVEVYGVVGGGDTHEHTYGDWQTNADNHWKVCTECGKSTAKVAHTFDSGVVTTPATGTSEGVMTYTCSACGYEKTEPIPMTDGLTEVSTSEQGATVTLGNGSTNTDLINGVTDSNYTLIAEGENCYAVIDLQQNYDLKRVNVYLYNFNYGFDIYGSTDGETWTKLGSNTVDSAVYNKDDGYAVEVSGSYRYVKVVGTSYQYGYFTVYEINVFADLSGEAHTHTPGENWESDGENHWKVCTGCGERLDSAAHTFDNGVVAVPATETSEGEKTYTCKDCGHQKTRVLPKLDTPEPVPTGESTVLFMTLSASALALLLSVAVAVWRRRKTD